MIRRYFYIFSASLFILITSTTGVKANIEDPRLEELARRTNSPPGGFNYQAVLRDSNGDVLVNSSVTMRFTLSNTGGDVWIETHSTTTNTYGMVTLVVGEGTQTGGSAASFAVIDWSTAISVKVEADTGNGFVDLGTNEFQSVPYAKYAENGLSPTQETKLDGLDASAETNVQADWNVTDNTSDAFVQNKPTIPADLNELTDVDGLLNGSSFDGAFSSLTGVPANLDVDATDDFDGAFGSLTGVPINLDTDGTDDFDGAFGSLSGVPANLDVDATDDFDGAFASLSGVPADLDTDVTDDFSGSYTDLTNVPANLATTADLIFSNATNVISAGDLDDDFVFGSDQLADANDLTKDNRMFFDKSSGAFRVGSATGTEWDTPGAFSFAAGEDNTASGSNSTVGGGNGNIASGSNSTVGGGGDGGIYGNTASGFSSTVGGGGANTASFSYTTIGGGYGNLANVGYATIGGGDGNSATETNATVGGGYSNQSTAQNSTVGGGFQNAADGNGSTVGGGRDNTATGVRSTISGGQLNSTSYANSTIGGGLSNTASQASATVAGGQSNLASANNSAVGGGTSNTSSGSASFVGGGDSNTASGTQATVGGGYINIASGNQSTVAGGASNQATMNGATVGGGTLNTAINLFSTVGGGFDNDAYGIQATIAGGGYNSANNSASVGGGYTNLASGSTSTISGGTNNTASALYSTVGGGRNNISSGNNSTVGGGQYVNAQAFGEFAVGLFSEDDAGTPDATAFQSGDRIFTIGNGTGTGVLRSNALVVLKNGNTDINGTLVANSLGVDGVFTLPVVDGTTGQRLSTNGAGIVTWADDAVSSDKRLKTDFRDLNNVLIALEKIDGYKFKWNDVQNRDQETDQIGFIAQEIRKVYPELVIEDNDGYLKVKYVSFIPILLEAIKELKTQNEILTEGNNVLESRQDKDEGRFLKLENQMVRLMKLMVPDREAVGKN